MDKERIISILFLYAATFALFMIDVPYTAAKEEINPDLVNYLVSGIYKKPEEATQRNLVPEQYPEVAEKCATPIIRLALNHPDLLDDENLFILYRPDNPLYIRYYAPDGSVPWAYDTPEGHFKIHYSESGTHAVYGSDGNQSTIPDYVVSFGAYFEQAWYYETDPNMFGYDPPPPDGNNGGDNRFDVYIKNISYYGYTSIEMGHPYIVVHNNYTGSFESNLDPEGSMSGNMKITAAHELFHSIQYFYDQWNNDCIWWEENTAVWMEDEVFDYVDGYLNYLGNPFDDLNDNLKWDSGEPWYKYNGDQGDLYGRPDDVWFEAPHISLDSSETSFFTRYEYGGVMWAKYLAARFGDEFIKDSFIITDYNTDALPAIQQALQDYGSSLEEAFTDFRIKVLTLDQNIFEEGEKYPLVRHLGNYGDYPVNLAPGEEISHLSCRYIGLKPPSGEWKLVINIDGEDYSDFGVGLVLFKDIGYEVQYIPIDLPDEQMGGIEVISFGAEGLYKRAAIIPMNLSISQDYRSIDIKAHLERCESNEISVEMNISAGWSMISLPVIPDDTSLSSLFPEAVTVYVFEKGPGYVRVEKDENLLAGKGYWIFIYEDQRYIFTGQPIWSYQKNVYERGWDMIGGCSCYAKASVNNCRLDVIYGYNHKAGYTRLPLSDNIKPGKGYWAFFNNVIDQARLNVHMTDTCP
ncbi:MAG: MXAN_6640 family putative metalloprotease [bacterium]